MTAKASIFDTGSKPELSRLTNARQPGQAPVKEVVSVPPGPDPYELLRDASRRMTNGQSVFRPEPRREDK